MEKEEMNRHTKTKDRMVFWFVVRQMFMCSPLLGLQTYVFAFLKVPTTCLCAAKTG